MIRLNVQDFCGYPVASGTRQEAVDAVLAATESIQPQAFRLVNAGTFYAAKRDISYQSLLRAKGVNFPDGRPLSFVLRWRRMGLQKPDQIRGPWLFEEVLMQGRRLGVKHYFYGTTDDTLGKLVAQVKSMSADIDVVGVYAPPFANRTQHEIETAEGAVRASGASLVWVAMGTPKQDAEAQRICNALGVTTVAVGAAFDYTARVKRQAPRPITALGLEWLYRLANEPRRLWRRYLLGNAHFLGMAFRYVRGKDTTACASP